MEDGKPEKGKILIMNVYEETKFLMKKYGITANKSLGQNFLIDDSTVENIVKSAKIQENDIVIEIGPGLGTLTNELLKVAKKVICIELDERMIKILKERFLLYDNIEIKNEDILKVDLNKIALEEKNNNDVGSFKIVANLPYYITTPIIMKLLEKEKCYESITVMVQKEVADRLCAIPGQRNAGAITYTVDYYSTAEKVLEVPKESFIPSPEVDSEVIKLTIRDNPRVELKNEELFFKIIKQAFMQRRKTLINALSANTDIFKNKEQIREIFKQLNIDEKVRGENLSIEQYAEIANKICT